MKKHWKVCIRCWGSDGLETGQMIKEVRKMTEIKFTKTHEWIKVEDGTATVGISDYAQKALGDVVFVGLPEEESEVTVDEAFGDVESVKAVSDLVSPVSGTVSEVNHELEDEPELLNSNPYGTWIIKVKDLTDTCNLMDEAAYKEFCGKEG